jgi:small-conductance mechanosensitive channel
MKWLNLLQRGMMVFGFRLIAAAVVVLVAALVIRILLSIVRRSLAAGKVEPTTSSLILSVCRFGAWVMVIVGVLWILHLEMISVALAGGATLGALGLGIGASATVADVFAGIFLLSDRQLAVGRRVAGAGVEGTVEAISVRKTMIRGDDGTLHLVPNRVLDAAAYSVKAGAAEEL